MKSMGSDWYRKVWTLDIKKQSWVENTTKEVDFICKALHLKGNERILDLGCGYGRHSLEFARRGYEVVGVDITKEYVDDANQTANEQNLSAKFLQSDIRDLTFEGVFDVVLNLADGGIGYLENEMENLKLFDVIANALKPGGQHFMDIMSADYADDHYPCQLWDAGSQQLTLSNFEWDKDSCILLYGQLDYSYGEPLKPPVFDTGCPTRLYHMTEIKNIMGTRTMHVTDMYGDYEGTIYSKNCLQMMVVSKKDKRI